MPIYEYECQKCGEVFEVLQKYSDPPPKTHKECGSRRVKRVMSRSSFILKGTGWYVTDYARKDKGGDAGGGSKKPRSSSKSDKSDKSDKAESSGSKDSKGSSPAADSGQSAA